jgi:aspartyl protease family protein
MRRTIIAITLMLASAAAAAADIDVVGLTAGKAVVIINGGKPRTLAAGQTSPEGVKLLSATSESATFEFAGKRRTLTTGQHGALGSADSSGGGSSASVTADSRGHFITTGTVNGISIRFMVDTGASMIALSVDEAKRAGVNYLAGTRSRVQTANGVAVVYMVKLDSVRVGDITVNNVDAMIVESDKLGIALLGMSFLNRMEMKRTGDTLTLIRRF